MINEIEVKIGNSKRLVLKDGILQEKGLTPIEANIGYLMAILSDVIGMAIIFLLAGREFGLFILVNSLVNRVVKVLI